MLKITTYTYIIHYTVQQETVLKDCDRPIDWTGMKADSLFRFNTPHGTMTINMRNVTSIEEVVNEIDPLSSQYLGDALMRNHFSAKATAKELDVSERTIYRKAKEHGLNVIKD